MIISLRPARALTISAGLALAAFSFGSPSISTSTAGTYHKAIREANEGQSGMAKATLRCLLMPNSISIGSETGPEHQEPVVRAIQVWSQRLPGAPFVFSRSSSPSLRVKFVSEIHGGGDLQGQVRCERQVHFGSFGSSYRVQGTILVRDNVEGRPISAEEATSVVEHELGHVLGLDDDPNRGCLMGPFVPGEPVDGPQQDELYVISTFRSALEDALQQIQGYPEARRVTRHTLLASRSGYRRVRRYVIQRPRRVVRYVRVRSVRTHVVHHRRGA